MNIGSQEHYHKGYKITLHFNEGRGCLFIISKEIEGKRVKLRQRNFYFAEPISLLIECRNYIDNHEGNLIKKLPPTLAL
jgi:hypothetical protein